MILKKSVKKSIKPKPKKAKIGRPKLKLCERDIEALAAIGCTNEEIATVLCCCADTIEKRFPGVCARGRGDMKNSLRRTQLDVALKDRNVSMLTWLGKQYCGQKDSKQEIDHKGEVPFIIKNYGTKPAKPWSPKKK